jgi:hypothetical protein
MFDFAVDEKAPPGRFTAALAGILRRARDRQRGSEYAGVLIVEPSGRCRPATPEDVARMYSAEMVELGS